MYLLSDARQDILFDGFLAATVHRELGFKSSHRWEGQITVLKLFNSAQLTHRNPCCKSLWNHVWVQKQITGANRKERMKGHSLNIGKLPLAWEVFKLQTLRDWETVPWEHHHDHALLCVLSPWFLPLAAAGTLCFNLVHYSYSNAVRQAAILRQIWFPNTIYSIQAIKKKRYIIIQVWIGFT